MGTGKTSRWALWLPIISAVVTIVLLTLAPLQDKAFFHANPGSRGYNGGFHFAPAWTLAVVLNGPAFLLGGAFGMAFEQFPDMLGRVFAAAAFWFYVGWVIDRQNRGRTLPLITKPKLNVVVQLFLLVISALLLLGTISQCSDVIVSLRLWGIRSAIFEELGIMVWLAAFTIFFARKAVFAARRLR